MSELMIGGGDSGLFWLCQDAEGHLGIFRSDSSGVIPTVYENRTDLIDSLTEKHVESFQKNSIASLQKWLLFPLLKYFLPVQSLREHRNLRNSWTRNYANYNAAKGLYCYTSLENDTAKGSAYCRVASPVPPIVATDTLPLEFKMVRMSGSFRDKVTVGVMDFVKF